MNSIGGWRIDLPNTVEMSAKKSVQMLASGLCCTDPGTDEIFVFASAYLPRGELQNGLPTVISGCVADAPVVIVSNIQRPSVAHSYNINIL